MNEHFQTMHIFHENVNIQHVLSDVESMQSSIDD